MPRGSLEPGPEEIVTHKINCFAFSKCSGQGGPQQEGWWPEERSSPSICDWSQLTTGWQPVQAGETPCDGRWHFVCALQLTSVSATIESLSLGCSEVKSFLTHAKEPAIPGPVLNLELTIF